MPTARYDFGSVDDPDELLTDFPTRNHYESISTLAEDSGKLRFSGHATVQPNMTVFPPIFSDFPDEIMLVGNIMFNGGAIATDYAFFGLYFPFAMVSFGIGHEDFGNESHVLSIDHSINNAISIKDSVGEYGNGGIHLMKMQYNFSYTRNKDNFITQGITLTTFEDGVIKQSAIQNTFGTHHIFRYASCPIVITWDTNAHIYMNWLVHAVQPRGSGSGILESAYV